MILFPNSYTSDGKAHEILMRHTQKRLEWQMKNVYLTYDTYNTGKVYENNRIYSARLADYFPDWVNEKDRDKIFDEVYQIIKSEDYKDISREPAGLMYEFVISHIVSKEVLRYKRYGLPENLKLTKNETDICLRAIKKDIQEEEESYETPAERLERYLSMEDFVDDFFWDEDFLLLYHIRKESIQNSFLNKVAGIV